MWDRADLVVSCMFVMFIDLMLSHAVVFFVDVALSAFLIKHFNHFSVNWMEAMCHGLSFLANYSEYIFPCFIK